MTTIEQGFLNFSKEEVAAGYEYALDKCTCLLDHASIRWVAEEAGAIRAKHANAPLEDVIREAVENYEKRERIYIPPLRFEVYVRSVGYMFGERNRVTRAKRKRDHAANELEAVSYGLEDAPEIDRATNDEIAHGLKGPAVYE